MNSRIKKIRNFLIILTVLLATQSLSAQGWERIYWGGGIVSGQTNLAQATAYKAFALDNGTYVFPAIINSSRKLVHTDEIGLVTSISDASISGDNVIKTADGNILNAYNSDHVHLVKMDLSGNILWDNVFTYPFSQGTEYLSDVLQSADGNYVFGGIRQHNTGLNEAEYLAYITKANEAGDVVWKTVTAFDSILHYSLTPTADGGYMMAGSSSFISQAYPLAAVLMKFDQDGQLLWTKSMDTPVQMKEIVLTADGGFVMVGRNSTNVDMSLVKIDSDGNHVWETIFSESNYGLLSSSSLLATNDNGFAFMGHVGHDITLIKTDGDGNVMWQQFYGGAYNDQGYDLKQTLDDGFIIAGSANQLLEDESFYIIKTDANGVSFSNTIEGYVQYDLDENCINDPGELALEDWIVFVEDSTFLLYGSVDANGYYSIDVDTGAFDVQVEAPNSYWQPCVAIETVQLSTNFDTVQVDFAIQSIEQCPLMVVTMHSSAILICEENQVIVNCQNQGTWIAEDVYVEITFDDSLEVLDASVPYVPLSGNTYSFDVGDIDFLQQENFTVDVMAGCDEELLGQTLCLEALVFPDSSCLPIDSLWSGASIETKAWCEGGEVKLRIKNIGTATMQQALEYIVIQDDVIMYVEPYGPLEVGDSILLTETANGTFYRIESPQEPFHPGNSMPSAFVEACGEGGNGEVSLGFVNQFALDDVDPFIDILCREVVGSYDPNIKVAFPEGFDAPHYIERNTDIEYVIHFQNTGTAAANLVVVQDVISPFLNPATIRPGASSHPFDFELFSDGIVKFTFENIMLPDSASDEAGSHGFIQFKISQKEDLPDGTEITNEAAIFFDSNAPVITNRTLHTIGENFITVDVGEIFRPDMSVNIYPNPFDVSTTFELQGEHIGSVSIQLFDAMGRIVITEQFSGTTYQFYRKNISAGIYFYNITDERGLLNSGKIIIQ